MTLKTDQRVSLELIKEIDLSVSNPPLCPASVIKLANEHFIVCDEMNHRLVELSSNGKFLRVIGRNGKSYGEFIYPKGLAVDTSGNILVADSGNHRVQKLTAEGQFILAIKGGGSWSLNEPADVAVLDDGALVIVDSGNHRIVKTSGEGKLIKTFGSRSSLSEEKAFNLSKLTRPALENTIYQGEVHFEFPGSVSVARDGLILIADPNNQRIAVTTADGYFVAYLPLPQNTRVDSIITSRQGFIFLTDSGQEHSLKQLTPEGVLVNNWKQLPGAEGSLRFPGGLLFCEDQLYLCDSFNHRILLFRLSEATPKQVYPSLTGQPAAEPLALQKYALHLETTGDYDEAKRIYQKLINGSPDYLPGYYHYLNYLTKFPDEREVKKHLPVLTQKIIVASKALISQMADYYREALVLNRELAQTRATYEQETLSQKAATDSLVAEQELLTQRSRQLAMKIRETAVEIEETWLLLSKITQRINPDVLSELMNRLGGPLAGYLAELLDDWSQLCRRYYLDTLVNWEKKFTQKGAAIAWSDIYLARRQITNERAVNAVRGKICCLIIDSLATIFRASSAPTIAADIQESILANFGRLCCYFSQEPQELAKLLSKFALLKDWLKVSPLPESELPRAIASLVKQLEPPFSPERPLLIVQLLTNKITAEERLKPDSDTYIELERVKLSLVKLVEHWQGRMLSNYSHHLDGLKRSAQLKNTIKITKKEKKRDIILAKRQASLTDWALQLSRCFYQQADFWVNRLFAFYLKIEEDSAAFLLTLSAAEREELLARLSGINEPAWEKTTEQHLDLMYKKREEAVNELAKWEYVSEQEVERWGYVRPGTNLYLEAARNGWNLLATAISGLNDNL